MPGMMCNTSKYLLPGMVRQLVINTSYQKLSFGSGDYPDKLLFHRKRVAAGDKLVVNDLRISKDIASLSLAT